MIAFDHWSLNSGNFVHDKLTVYTSMIGLFNDMIDIHAIIGLYNDMMDLYHDIIGPHHSM